MVANYAAREGAAGCVVLEVKGDGGGELPDRK